MSLDAADVRTWARYNGHAVAEAGRLPAGVIAAYLEAHPEASTDDETAALAPVEVDVPPDDGPRLAVLVDVHRNAGPRLLAHVMALLDDRLEDVTVDGEWFRLWGPA